MVLLSQGFLKFDPIVFSKIKTTVDYIIVRQEDKAKVRNVKVISNEECVPATQAISWTAFVYLSRN